MRQTYQQSCRVLVWLGESTIDTKPAMSLIKTLDTLASTEDIPNVQSFDARLLQRYGIPSLLDYTHARVMEIFKLPWFQRAWIIQEVVLPPVFLLHWGREMLDWDKLRRAVDIGERLKLPFAHHPACAAASGLFAERDRTDGDQSKSLLDILIRVRSPTSSHGHQRQFNAQLL